MTKPANAMRGEATFAHDGQVFTIVFDAEAFFQIEDALDLEMFALFQMLSDAERKKKPIKIGTLATLLQCGLAQHHPDVTRGDAGEMLFSKNPEIAPAIGTALVMALPQGGDPGTGNPRKPVASKASAPAKPKRGTGRK